MDKEQEKINEGSKYFAENIGKRHGYPYRSTPSEQAREYQKDEFFRAMQNNLLTKCLSATEAFDGMGDNKADTRKRFTEMFAEVLEVLNAHNIEITGKKIKTLEDGTTVYQNTNGSLEFRNAQGELAGKVDCYPGMKKHYKDLLKK